MLKSWILLPQEYTMSIHVGIPKPLLQKIKEERERTGMTTSDIVRRGLDLYFEKKEAQRNKEIMS